jgi:hypothetical protein
MTKLDPKDCPDFDEDDLDKSITTILKWSRAKLEPNTINNFSYYTMIWEKGFMGAPYQELRWAQLWSALFIYLWCKGIGAGLADHLCCSFTSWQKRLAEKDKK